MPPSSKNGEIRDLTQKPKKANTFAIAGFLTPFVAAGITCGLILMAGDDFRSSKVFLIYELVIPVLLIIGVIMSIKSIPRIPALGDKDYAYTGLLLSIFFLAVFFLSLLYFG
jgi:hypothetical protein